jgi:hypothetical protein
MPSGSMELDKKRAKPEGRGDPLQEPCHANCWGVLQLKIFTKTPCANMCSSGPVPGHLNLMSSPPPKGLDRYYLMVSMILSNFPETLWNTLNLFIYMDLTLFQAHCSRPYIIYRGLEILDLETWARSRWPKRA